MNKKSNFANFRQCLIVFFVYVSFLFPEDVSGQILGSYGCVGGTQSYTVPAGVCRIKMKSWGAGSGGGGVDGYPGGAGSGGSYAELTINVSAGDVLTVYVACRGYGGSGCGANFQGGAGGWGYGRGGNGGASGPVPCSGSGGGGGGSSAVLLNGALVLAAAGGGGGGGAGCTSTGGIGGAGGQNGGASTCTGGGTAAINGTFNGATGSTHAADGGGGGGGGGGAFNGGQGGLAPPSGNSCNPANDCGAGGGAGGNSYAPGGVIINGSGLNPGNAGDPDLCGSCAAGGGSQSAGYDGYVVIYDVPSLMSSTMSKTDVFCNGGNDGTASVSVSGGSSPYSYLWSDNSTLQQASNLQAGNYSVTVTDAYKCKIINSGSILEPTPLNVSISKNDASCEGYQDGNATAIVSGGTPGYAYLWNTSPVQTNLAATQIPAGNYSFTITDANSCKSVSAFTISQPLTLSISTSKTDVSCFQGSDGTASVNPSGGTPLYSYIWNTLPAQTGQTASNLKPGIYDVTLTDMHACMTQAQVQIQEPPLLNVSISGSTDVSCNGGNDGTAAAAVLGGTATYSYLWNSTPPNASQNASGLPAGNYTLTVTDSKLCKASASVLIKEPAKLTSSVSSTIVSCNGGNDGTASVIAGGGIPPYTYSWNTNPVQTNSTATSLTGTTFIITITDSNSCKTVNAIQVSEPAAINIGSTLTNVSCMGKNDGSIVVAPSGGTSPYTYVWSTSPSNSSAKISGLKPGNYDVTVTDSKGCTSSKNFNISEPAGLTSSHSQTIISCFGGNDGTATAIVNGGTTPYTYLWNTVPVQTNMQSTSLSVGTFTVRITDNNNCFIVDTVKITEPPPLLSIISGIKNVSCKSGSDGAASVIASGGTVPYSYLWNSTPPQGLQNANNLSAGSYSVSVTDGNGCMCTASFAITEPTSLSISTGNLINVSCMGGSNGSVTAAASGGTKPYSYLWNTNPVQNGNQAFSLTAGSYVVSVIDSNQCSATSPVSITEPAILISNIASSKNVSCYGGNDGNANASVIGGTLPYSYAWNTLPVQTSQNASLLSAGPYMLTVTDNNGCKDSTSIIINQPAQMQASISSITNVSCFNSGNGSASVAVNGGTPPYSYVWNTVPVQTNATANSLVSGSYTVTVKDSLSCSVQTNVNILGPLPLQIFIAKIIDASCLGSNDGSVIANATGGVPKYSYQWGTSPPQTDSIASGLSAGIYPLTVMDSQNCQTNTTVTITEPMVLSASIQSKKDVSCFGYQDGEISVTQSGGTSPYTYLWSGGETTASVNGLKAGTYQLTITDLKQCLDTLNFQIFEPLQLVSNIGGIKNVSCKGGKNGEAFIVASGGTPAYKYSWNTMPVQTTDTAGNLPAGKYTVILSDNQGCIDTTNLIISEPDSVIVIASGATILCIGQDVLISSSASGGTPNYTYLWDTGESSSSLMVSPDTTRTYKILAMDANLCVSTADSVTIVVRPELDAHAFPVSPICRKESATLQAIASGGDGNYTYLWKPLMETGEGPILVSPTATTVYTVVVYDGCGTPADSDLVTVLVNPLPMVNFSGDTLKGCMPHTVQYSDLSTIVSSSQISSLQWDMGDYASSDNTSNSENPEHTYSQNGIYSVGLIATSSEGCSDTLIKRAYVSVYPPSVSNFYTDKDTVQIFKPEFAFYEQAEGEISYQWDFGDGSTSSESNPRHTYGEAGSFQVCLSVTSAFMCTNIFCKTLIVEEGFSFYVPNAFTPDNDGLNDYFGGAGTSIKTCEMHIFDRWGNMIFFSDDIDQRWDGHANGGKEKAQIDVYLYMIKIKDIFDRDHSFVGHVSLMK